MRQALLPPSVSAICLRTRSSGSALGRPRKSELLVLTQIFKTAIKNNDHNTFNLFQFFPFTFETEILKNIAWKFTVSRAATTTVNYIILKIPK